MAERMSKHSEFSILVNGEIEAGGPPRGPLVTTAVEI